MCSKTGRELRQFEMGEALEDAKNINTLPMSKWCNIIEKERKKLKKWETEWLIDMVSFHHVASSICSIRTERGWEFNGNANLVPKNIDPEHISAIIRRLTKTK